MDSPCAALVGTSPVYFTGLSNVKSPLYDFFDIHIIEDLSEEQTLVMIRKNLEWEQRIDILKDFDALIPKIKAMHTMTGGNPRLIIILYELIANDNLMEVKNQFQELLDRISPFYQERMKDLAPQERALLETMALMRTEPRTPANIAKQLRKPPQQTSSLLKRMTKAGYLTVSENPRDKRSRLYRIKEGFFDLWLAMSESRVHKKRLGYLVEFFEMYYKDREDREKKREELWHKLEGETKEVVKKENNLELLDYLSEIGDTFERCKTKLELAIHKIKKGDAKEAERFLKEVESISPKSQTLTWMTDQAHRMAKEGLDFDVSKWLDEMIDYWRTQRSGHLEKAVAIAHKFGKDLSGHGLHKIRIELLSDALKHTDESSEKYILYNEIAQSQEMDGQLSNALSSMHKALILCNELNDRKGQGTMLNNISQIYDLRGDYETALKYLKDSLEIRRKVGDKLGEGVTLSNMGNISYSKGDYQKALKYMEDCLEIMKEIGDKRGEGVTLNNISQIYDVRGDHETALKYLEDSLKIKREIGDKRGQIPTLHNMAMIEYKMKKIEKMLAIEMEAYKLAVATGNAMGLFQVGKILGNLLIQGGQREEGFNMLRLSYNIGLSAGLPGTENIKQMLLTFGVKME